VTAARLGGGLKDDRCLPWRNGAVAEGREHVRGSPGGGFCSARRNQQSHDRGGAVGARPVDTLQVDECRAC
jgi:hypothetical protein